MRCLADATEAGRPITWNRNWGEPLGHRVQHPRQLAHSGCHTHASGRLPRCGLQRLVQQVAAAQAQLADEPACPVDAQWLQGLCTARTAVRMPWGWTRRQDLIRIVDALAHEVTAASDSGTGPVGLPADRRQGSCKSSALDLGNAERVGVSLPTQLRPRQWVLARVAPCCDGRPRNGRAPRLGQLHPSSGWHRCAIGPSGRSHGSAPQRPILFSSKTRCDGSSASRPGTSRHVRLCLRRSSD